MKPASNRDKSRRAVANIRNTTRASIGAGRQIAFGSPIPVNARKRYTTMKLAANPPLTPPPQSREDAMKAVGQIATLLGVDPRDADTLNSAFASLLQAAGLTSDADDADDASTDGPSADNAALRQMTDSERRACKALRCSPKNFLEAKRSFDVKHIQASVSRESALKEKYGR